MKIRTINIAFIILFMAALIIPLSFVNLYGGNVSEQENRVLAARPPISYAFQHPRSFIRKFDEWFTDNVGFRENFINFYKVVQKLENNVQYTDGSYIMLIGEQGHHFFAHTNGWMIGKFQGKPFLTDEQLQGMVAGLNKANQYLTERNIPLIVMFCVDKETIYPEFYPRAIHRGSEPIQLDIVTEYIKRNTEFDIFNIKEALLSVKDTYPVFDRVGDAADILSHYNEIGAFFAYQELMRHINNYLPEIEVFTLNDVQITYADKGIYPDIPDVQLIQEIKSRRLNDDFFKNVPLGHPSQGIAFENNDSSLPKILILRDSYTGNGNYLSRYLPEHFGQTVLIDWVNMVNLESYIEYFKPDIVVFISAERELSRFANSISSLQNLEK